MLENIRYSLGQHKFMAILPVLALAMVIPALMLGLTSPTDIRTKAARESCSKQDPCIGTVTKDKNNFYILKEEIGNIYSLKSLKGIKFQNFLNKRVKAIGNIIKEGKRLTLYVSSMEIYQIRPTPVLPTVIIYDLRISPTSQTPDGQYKLAIWYKTNIPTTAILSYTQPETTIGGSLTDDIFTSTHNFTLPGLTEGKYIFKSIASSRDGSARIEGSFTIPNPPTIFLPTPLTTSIIFPTPQTTSIVFPTPQVTSIVLPTPTISWYNCIPAYGCSPVTGGQGQYSSYESCLANCR